MHKSTSCFETIRLQDGVIHNIKYHNHRLNQTRKALYNATAKIDILNHLSNLPAHGLHKIKITYSDTIMDISIQPYKPKQITDFLCINTDIDYSYKYTNRDELNDLTKNLKPNQEIIIIKDNLITDTSIANIALYIDNQWFTPATPLLAGTTRARLLNQGQIKTAHLYTKDLGKADSIALMNAMIGFHQINNKESICQCK